MRRVREEKSRREKSREEKESEERRCRCAKSRLAKAAGAEPSGQIRDEKLYAVVARRTFPSQNVQNTRVGPLLEVEMWKKCTPLWREACFQVKTYKTPQGSSVSEHIWKL